MENHLRIQQVRSQIGHPEKQRQILRALGFTKMNQVKTIIDTPVMRGMVNKVKHLVRIVEK